MTCEVKIDSKNCRVNDMYTLIPRATALPFLVISVVYDLTDNKLGFIAQNKV